MPRFRSISAFRVLFKPSRGAEWLLALQLLTQISDQQLLPDVVILSSVISACEKARKWQMALRSSLHVAFLDLIHLIFTYSLHNLISVSQFINRSLKMSPSKAPRGFLLSMKADFGLEANVITCNAALSALEKAQKATKAVALLALAGQPDVISYSATLAAQKSWPEGLRLLEEMRSKQVGAKKASIQVVFRILLVRTLLSIMIN